MERKWLVSNRKKMQRLASVNRKKRTREERRYGQHLVRVGSESYSGGGQLFPSSGGRSGSGPTAGDLKAASRERVKEGGF